MVIQRIFDKVTFKPEINNIDIFTICEQKKVETPLRYKLHLVLCWFFSILFIVETVLTFVIPMFYNVLHLLWMIPFLCLITFIVVKEFNIIMNIFEDIQNDDNNWTDLKEKYDTHNHKQLLVAEEWRKLHPLEEKCRLAMTKNPNYVADLIRYIKEKEL